MKKLCMFCLPFLFMLTVFLTNSFAVELVNGIDVDKVYNSGDWSSKEKIKDIINDYSLLLQYKQKLLLCNSNKENLSCLNELTKDIINSFYNFNKEKNIKEYYNYVNSVSTVYGIVYCLNKYIVPAGTMCNQENMIKVYDVVEEYVRSLLQQTEHELLKYDFISDYKV